MLQYLPKLKAAVPLSLISLTNGVWWQLSNLGWKRDLLKHGNTENKERTQGAQIDISKFTQLKEEVLGAVSIVNYSFNHLGFRIKAKRLIEEKLFSSTNPWDTLGYARYISHRQSGSE